MSTTFQKALGRALILAGALAFAFWGQLQLKQFRIQSASLQRLETEMSQARGPSKQNDLRGPVTKASNGVIIGRLEIPRIHISVMVLEGSDSSILDVAAGHVEGTALPGTMGNVAIAAHRDTFFHALGEVRTNDIIHLKTLGGDFRYAVEGMEVVEPSDIRVLRQTRDAELTLITCYPFYYIGAAPKRFIVHAHKAG